MLRHVRGCENYVFPLLLPFPLLMPDIPIRERLAREAEMAEKARGLAARTENQGCRSSTTCCPEGRLCSRLFCPRIAHRHCLHSICCRKSTRSARLHCMVSSRTGCASKQPSLPPSTAPDPARFHSAHH